MKPTPAPLEIISSKRPRTTQRASASKRKVLMDETMVLLGEYVFSVNQHLQLLFLGCFYTRLRTRIKIAYIITFLL